MEIENPSQTQYRSTVKSSLHIYTLCYIVLLQTGRSGVRSPKKKRSSNLSVQTGSGVHLASCTMGTGGSFLGSEARLGRDAEHSPPSSAEVVNE
jgi:hypothetical protein